MLQIGPYQVLREIARGGMGAVYLAQSANGEQVAIKLMLEPAMADPELQVRFEREALALQALRHPGILRVRTHAVDRGRPYMVMDLLTGSTLADAVEAEGPLPSARVAQLGQRMASALAHAHSRGVIHRDLKPPNVMLEQDQPVLVDFGLVHLVSLDVSRLTASGTIMGSPAFMSPEQVDGKPATPLVDVYGLGATLYFLLTGKPPCEGKSAIETFQRVLLAPPRRIRELRPEVSEQLEAIVLRCLDKDPDQRFGSAVDLEDALSFLRPSPVRTARRGWAALTLGIATAAGVGAWIARDDPKPGLGPTRTTVEAQTPASSNVSPAHAAESKRLVDVARSRVKRREFDQALADLEQAIRLDPTNVAAHFGCATVLAGTKRLERALEYLDAAVELAPTNAQAYLNRGSVLCELEHFEASVRDFTRALGLDPSLDQAYAARGHAYAAQERFVDAGIDLAEALKRNPEQATTHLSVAVNFMLQGRDEEALEAYDMAEALGLRQAILYANRGHVQLRLGNRLAAIADVDLALKLDTGLIRSYRTRARAHLELRQFAAAEADVNLGLSAAPEDAALLGLRGAARVEQARAHEALADCNRSLKLMPDFFTALLARAQAQVYLQRFDLALIDLDRVLELDPDHFGARCKRAESYAQLQRFDDALSEYHVALEAKPDDPIALTGRAAVRLQTQDWEGALDDVNAALAREYLPARNLACRGRALAQLKRFDEALSDFDRSLALEPNNATNLLARGICLEGLKHPERALEDYTRALALKPEDQLYLHYRGRVLLELERFEEAIKDLELGVRLSLRSTHRQEFQKLLDEARAGSRRNKEQ